jgi:hypothetical protein
MSIALHCSKLAAEQIHLFLQGTISRATLEQQYSHEWRKNFSRRLATGRLVQRLFGHKWLTNSFIHLAKKFPRMVDLLIRQTHGRPF